MQNNPIRVLTDFLKHEESIEGAKTYEKMRFVGYALNIGFDELTLITSDPYKIAVGGIPRNSFLIMISIDFRGIPPHFTLLRVLESATTPLSREVQQTYFELQKRSMPEIDVFTQSELQWGGLKTEILGMFYPSPDDINGIEFSADINNYLSSHKYKIYSPTVELLDVIVNSLIPQDSRYPIGYLRMTESRLYHPNHSPSTVPVYVSTTDFMGTRTALFGKTRLGKSNTIKLLVQSLIETTKESKNVGQVIFDINSEYANDNTQNRAISTIYPDKTVVYAINPKVNVKALKVNFYEFPGRSHRILGTLLNNDGRGDAIYVRNFITANIPTLEEYNSLTERREKLRVKRRILIYWAILKEAGFDIDEAELVDKTNITIDPNYNKKARAKIYNKEPPKIKDLNGLINELKKFKDLLKTEKVNSSSGKPLFDSDDVALLDFLKPNTGAGPNNLKAYRIYHDQKAGDFINNIIEELDEGLTVILDLGNAHPIVMEYYSEYLSKAIFQSQLNKFAEDNLKNHFVQLYFEEAHNLFPNKDSTEIDIYRRLAKEGAKYHIGIVYSTQSVSSVHPDLLAQTENFFIAHMSSEIEVDKLARVNVEYASSKKDILRSKQKGFIRMLTRSHRFVIPVQIKLFEGE